jgi:hypothetical protein
MEPASDEKSARRHDAPRLYPSRDMKALKQETFCDDASSLYYLEPAICSGARAA